MASSSNGGLRSVWLGIVCCVLWFAALVSSAQAGNVQYVYDELGRMVQVVVPSGASAQYTFDAANNISTVKRSAVNVVSISEFSPNSGSAGASVAIYGSGFSTTTTANTVQFNGVAATVTAATANKLTVTAPAGVTTGKITVTNVNGTATSTANFQVVSNLAPVISSFTPIIAVPGTNITISGGNFQTAIADNKVRINGRSALVKTSIATSLGVSVGTGNTSGKINVTTPYGSATSTADLFVVPSPYVATDVQVTGRMSSGQSKAVAITTAGKKAMILFDGTAGQGVSMTLNSNTIASGTVKVITPDGVVLASKSLSSGNLYFEPGTLPVTGSYLIFIDPTSTSAGSLTIGLSVFNNVSGTIALGGAAVTAATTLAGQKIVLNFSGTAGQKAFFKFTAITLTNSSSAFVTVSKLDGTVLSTKYVYNTTGTGYYYIDTTSLPATGTYQVTIDPSDAGTASLSTQLYNVPVDAAATLSVGGVAATTSTTVPGQGHTLSFSGTAGQKVFFKFSAITFVNGNNAYVTVLKPDGTTLATKYIYNTSGTDYYYIDTTGLPTTGTYKITINPDAIATGSVTTQLYNVPTDAAATLTVGGAAATTSATIPGQGHTLSFSGTAGQKVFFKFSAITFVNGNNAYVTVLKPDGTTLDTKYIYNTTGTDYYYIDTTGLPTTGTYKITINPDAIATGSVTTQLYNVPTDAAATLTVGGAAATTSATMPGQGHTLSFSGTAGQKVFFKFSAITFVNGNNAYVTVLKPDGTTLDTKYIYNTSGTDYYYIDTTSLPTTGTYKITINPDAVATGSVTTQLYNVPADAAATLTVGGAAAATSATIPGQGHTLSFSGTAGQKVFFKFSAITFVNGNNAYVTVLKPDGTTLDTKYIYNTSGTDYYYIDTTSLPTTGTYKITINPDAIATGSVTTQLYNVPANAAATATLGGAAVTTNNTVPGQGHTVSFNGTAGQKVYFKFSAITFVNGNNAYVTVLNPDGSSLATKYIYNTTGTEFYYIDATSLPSTGVYKINIDPDAISTGSVATQLSIVP